LRTLHTYLTRQILASLIMTAAVFTFVLLLGNALKQILPLLVNRQVGFGSVATALWLLIPFVWVFALPMGMLTATLLIFGRFSADQELTAVRASGVSLLTLITPVLLLSLALCGVSALVNMEVGPRFRVKYNDLMDRLKAELTTAQLPEGRFIRDCPGYIFYIGKNRHQTLEDIMVWVTQGSTNSPQTVKAPRGQLEMDPANKRLVLHLYEARTVFPDGGTGITDVDLPLEFGGRGKRPQEPKIDDMTFGQLWDELDELERTLADPVPRQALTPEQVKALKARWEKERNDLTAPIRFHIHRQVAFSFACFGFTLVGIPLGIRVHRRETNIGIAIALLLVAVYYSFVLLAHALIDRPEFAPHLLVWLPNFVFQAAGAVMLWRANRGI
jgi:lipopolysaccharide export system permease protein